MDLYKLTVLHGGPKSSCTATLRYLLAESDEEVYDYLCGKANWDVYYDQYLEDKLENPEDYADFDKSPKDIIIKNRGDLEDDKWDDAYYGIWKYGWEKICAISEDEINVLKKFAIL